MTGHIWRLYDALIGGIPEDSVVDEVLCGVYFALVRSGVGSGLGMVLSWDTRPIQQVNKTAGMKLRDLAQAVKSWNFNEASIGLAAINAHYNALPTAQKNGFSVSDSRYIEDRVYDPFICYQKDIRNKKVAVIEHFPYLEQLFQPICDLTILSRAPQDNEEYPYSAAEYLLPECQYVFITCGALIDKALPRFLELSQNAQVVLVGPSTPLAPVLAEFGVSELSGFVIKDPEQARRICLSQENHPIYSSGQKVRLRFQKTSTNTPKPSF